MGFSPVEIAKMTPEQQVIPFEGQDSNSKMASFAETRMLMQLLKGK